MDETKQRERALQRRVNELQILESLLEERWRQMEEQRKQDMQKQLAPLVAENNRLRAQLGLKENKTHAQLDIHPETEAKAAHGGLLSSDVEDSDDDNAEDWKKCYMYHCPVYKCQYRFGICKSYKPPLNEDYPATVSDQVPWSGSDLVPHQKKIRRHMRLYHDEFEEDEWPLGFALVHPE